MNREHENDISIGRGQWIAFDEPMSDRENAVNIDPLMESLRPMWRALETKCVSACCGIDAFDLWEEEVKKNTSEFSQAETVNHLVRLKANIFELEDEILVSATLNNYFTKSTFLQMLDHLLDVYKKLGKALHAE